jgi:release factor glutamine methyltransferase
MGYLGEGIRGFEPRMALDGGNSGLETITKVVIKAGKLLKTRGYLFMEIGDGQCRGVIRLLLKNGFRLMKKFFDYNKTIRCIMSTKIN